MNVKKVFLDELPSCYAVNRIQKDDKDYLLVASEVENSCLAYDVNDNFSKICDYVDVEIDGAVFDVGVSSMQIDDSNRGFSYTKNGPLDMRMDDRERLTAYDIIKSFSESELSDILYNYGEEKRAKYLANKIVKCRQIKDIKTTLDLVDVISSCVQFKYKMSCVKRVFQALRIYVNNELNELQYSIGAVSKIIKSGGVLSVISFHSLEDRIVKNFFINQKDIFKNIQKRVIIPRKEEIKNNSRSASAKLRYAEKI